jgi:hypothetical protein
MVIAYLVAAAFAAFAARGGPEFPKLAFWRRWDPAAIYCSLGVVYLIYALTGVLVTGLAEHFGLRPLSNGAGRAWVNGAAYGAVAMAFLRLNLEVVGLDLLSPARVLLKAFLRSTTPMLDNGASRTVARKVGDLRPRPLCRASWQLYLRHVEGQVQPRVAVEHAQWLREQHRLALDGGSRDPGRETDAAEAQERLRFYAERLIIDHEDSTIEFDE